MAGYYPTSLNSPWLSSDANASNINGKFPVINELFINLFQGEIYCYPGIHDGDRTSNFGPKMKSTGQKTVLFIFSPFGSHITKTTILARKYGSMGSRVVYCLFRDGGWLHDCDFAEVVVTKSEPIGYNPIDTRYHTSTFRIKHQIAREQLEHRQLELRELVVRLKPDTVFFDELCVYDYFLVADLIENAEKVVLIPTLPNCPGTVIPPLDTPGNPGFQWKILWKLRQIRLSLRNHVYFYFHPIFSARWTIKNSFNANKPFRYSFYANHYPVIKETKRWYLSAPEFDFFPRPLPKNEYAVGPHIDIDRPEMTHPRVDYFLKKHHMEAGSKLIYCGFGLVIQSFVSNQTLLNFYKKLNILASRNPSWNFLVTIPSDLMDEIRPSGFNMMFVRFVPQLKVFPATDLFITHGGGSVMEAIACGVPMLCVPPVDKLDYNGNAARIAYHGIGLTAKLEDEIGALETKIRSILESNAFRERTLRLSIQINKSGNDAFQHGVALP